LEPENAVAPADLRKWRDPESMNDADREDPFLTKALSVLAGA
jgi:hypothetical protein